MTSSWSRRFLLFCTLALFTFLAACSSSDTPQNQVLTRRLYTDRAHLLALLSEQTRTVTGDSILVIGSVSDDAGAHELFVHPQRR